MHWAERGRPGVHSLITSIRLGWRTCRDRRVVFMIEHLFGYGHPMLRPATPGFVEGNPGPDGQATRDEDSETKTARRRQRDEDSETKTASSRNCRWRPVAFPAMATGRR